MVFIDNSTLPNSKIINFEVVIGFTLPDDYRQFLQRHNGGAFKDGYPEVASVMIGGIYIQYLFGLGMRHRALDLEFWHQEMKGELPKNSLLIGKDPGGAFILLCCDALNPGVFLYDHAHRYPTSSELQNTYFITDRFAKITEACGIAVD